MNAVQTQQRAEDLPSAPQSRPSQNPEDYPAWREGLLVGAALLALTLLQYWHLAFH